MRDASIYRMDLDYFDEPYRIDKFEELFDKKEEDKKDDDKKKEKDGDKKDGDKKDGDKKDEDKKDKDDDKKKADKDTLVVINMQGMLDRITRVSPSFGSQGLPVVLKKGEKTYVFYASNHDGGQTATFRTVLENGRGSCRERVCK